VSSFELSIVDARDPGVEPLWRDLEAASSPGYFLTWGFVSTWLAAVPRDCSMKLVAIRVGGRVVAAFLLGRRFVLRHGFVPSRTLHLNNTGDARLDEVCVEHNAILTRPGTVLSLARLVEALHETVRGALGDDWDELFLPAIEPDALPGDALGEPIPGHRVILEREVRSPYVELERVRRSSGGYVALLRANVRAQVRRAQRGFGPLEVEIAHDQRSAILIYEELVHLHGLSWRDRGQPGAFADPWFDAFHRRLVVTRMPHGEIQLVRVRAAGKTIGCLYNLVGGRRVYFYQSGLARFDDPHLKAGFACHAEAVRINAELGHATYDFLAGSAQYKHALGTAETTMSWARIQRNRRRFVIEDAVRKLRRAVPTSPTSTGAGPAG
jgi:CelD/BcsL family acetyltransferase involved in cellulose biosynthesis